MRGKEPLVVGFDPGTTVGIAWIDVHERGYECYSSKTMSFEEIIRFLIDKGRPIIIATDKSTIPTTIDKLATKIGAKVIAPPKDLTTHEKKLLLKLLPSIPTQAKKKLKTEPQNAHEFDALTALAYGLREMRPLFTRVSTYVINRNIPDMYDEILISNIRNEDLSIEECYRIVRQQKAPKPFTQSKSVNQTANKPSHLTKLHERIEQLTMRMEQLRDENTHLKSRLHDVNSSHQQLKKNMNHIVRERSYEDIQHALKQLVKGKESRIEKLQRDNKQLKKNRKKIIKEKKILIDWIHNKSLTILARLENLCSYSKYEEVMTKQTRESITIFIDDPLVHNPKVLQHLNDLAETDQHILLITSTSVSATIRKRIPVPIIVVDSDEVQCIRGFVAINSEHLQQKRSEMRLLRDVLSKYKRERQQMVNRIKDVQSE